MRYVRLKILSLEDRRSIIDELTLYKIHMGIMITTQNDSLNFHTRTRPTRQTNNVFYLPFVTTNVEYFAPLLRMQRNHDLVFSNLDLNDRCFAAFKRYATNEVSNNRILFNYTFEQ